MTSGVQVASAVIGPVPFNTFCQCAGEVMECLLIKSSNTIKLGTVNAFKDGVAIQRDLGGLD